MNWRLVEIRKDEFITVFLEDEVRSMRECGLTEEEIQDHIDRYY